MADRIPFGKILIACVTLFLFWLLMWTVSSTLPAPLGPNPYEKFDFGPIGNGALILGLLSAAGFIVTAFAWIVVGVISSFRGRYAESQVLFSKKNGKSSPGE